MCSKAQFKFKTLIIVSLLLLAACNDSVDHPSDKKAEPTGSISGFVTSLSSGAIIPEVTINVAGTETYTDNNGLYSISDIVAGTNIVTARKAGFKKSESDVEIAVDENLQYDIVLQETLPVSILTGQGAQLDVTQFTMKEPGSNTAIAAQPITPNNTWASVTEGSWIGPTIGGFAYVLTGTYEYRVDFNVGDASLAELSGVWGADNSATAELNGIEVVNAPGDNFMTLNELKITDSTLFNDGKNTLVFLVNNSAGPSGLYVNFTVRY